MKTKKSTMLALAFAAIYGLAACGGGDDHDHDHDKDGKEAAHKDGDKDDHDHDKETAHKDGDKDEHGHDHEKIIAGPNGGRVLTDIEPHAEFFVMEDRKVQIAFVDDDIKAIPAAEQTVNVTAGDRSNPTKLSFEKKGDVLISDKALPEGNLFPVVVMIKNTSESEAVREKFNMNLEQCPDCPNKEYACTCEH